MDLQLPGQLGVNLSFTFFVFVLGYNLFIQHLPNRQLRHHGHVHLVVLTPSAASMRSLGLMRRFHPEKGKIEHAGFGEDKH